MSAGDGCASIEGPGVRFALRRPRPEIVDAMRRLTPPGEDEDLLVESVLAVGGTDSLARWFYCVNELGQRGLIRRSLYVGDTPLATLVPVAGAEAHRRPSESNGSCSGDAPILDALVGRPLAERNGHAATTTNTSYSLSRFTYLRRDGAAMIVESPLAHARIVLHDPRAAALIAALAGSATISDLAVHSAGMPTGTIMRFLNLLHEARMLESDGDEALEAWEFHDLLFHSRSRRGRTDAPFGGTYRLAYRPPPPAVKSDVATDVYPLYRPDHESLERDDPPLSFVVEHRRSIRKYGQQPVTARQLGEFLYRVARVKDRREAEVATPAGNVQMDCTARPYPAGGALYELEFYTAIRACQGIEGGLYHYNPVEHRLARVDGIARHIDELLNEAAAAAGIDAGTLQVLVVLAARFERIAWKYESIAYALVLKHVGVVYQTMYLAATAMGLAPCALGCGDSDLFARASGNDYYVETSVGEFLLGSRASH